VSVIADPAPVAPAASEPSRDDGAADRWSLLSRLEQTSIATRAEDGAVLVRRAQPAGCILYGPYWHLATGRYRLSFECRAGTAPPTAQPVLGVEIIVLSRFQIGWRDVTATELRTGRQSLVFDVPPELGADGGNEARFEFRFFHLGDADLSIEAIELARLPVDDPGKPDPRVWRLIGRLRKSWLGRRDANGALSVRQGQRAGCVLYGGWPYLRLARGRYRLTVGCLAGVPRLPAQPVLGVEILGRSRWHTDDPWHRLARIPQDTGTQLVWRDFRADEMRDDKVSVDFVVPTEMGLEAGADAPFEIRLYHLGNAELTIDAVDLRASPADDSADDPGANPGDVPPARWRLLGRLRKARIGKEGPDGVTVGRNELPGRWLSGDRVPLRLREGRYRLTLDGDAGPEIGAGAAALRVELFERRRRAGWAGLLPARSVPHFAHEFTSANLSAGTATVAFEVPPPADTEAGDMCLALAIDHFGNADMTIAGIELCREPDGDGDADGTDIAGQRPAQGARASRRKKLVFIGNCQCSVLTQAFNQTESLNRIFEAKYHFVQLLPNLHEFAQRDIEECDVLLIQDVDLWNSFPLRHCIRPDTETIRFPLVRFASLWPFDAWNGPGDREAHDREAPNSTFPFLDGLLGRLRRDIPDREARFLAYRALEREGIVNYRRLHALEERRLLKIDQTYDCRIGEFTLENFRTRQVFHTTVRPNWQGFNLLLRSILKPLGISGPDPLSQTADATLKVPQVPVHPKVARDLGVKWADERTRYLAFGQELTWENYIRRYIDHYG